MQHCELDTGVGKYLTSLINFIGWMSKYFEFGLKNYSAVVINSQKITVINLKL